MQGDLISRSALLQELNLYEEELRNDRELAIETDDENMLFAIMNQETAICRIRRNVLHMNCAYDVEKVIEQIHNKFENFVDEIIDNPEHKDNIEFLLHQNKEICRIVRNGGKE